MSAMPEIELERQLAALTTWSGPTPHLWRRARRTAGQRRGWASVRNSRWVFWGPTIAAAAVLAIVIGSQQPRRLPPATPDAAGLPRLHSGQAQGVQRGVGYERYSGEGDAAGLPIAGAAGDFVVQGVAKSREGTTFGDFVAGRGVARGETAKSPALTTPASNQAGERHVVRKASLELIAADVRAAFDKARHVVSEARGEYVQESGVTGDERQLQAGLTLRVAADRLSDVLSELRALGKVRAETSGGEDVTAQVVDLEARLTNEKRVEAELLKLLETRQDAPLKDVLELRTAIGNVRQSIEQITAQRERLGRLVSLATVLVIIRPTDLPPPAQTGLGSYFFLALRDALSRAGLLLIDSAAWLVRVAVGGLMWWVLLIVVALLARRWWRKRQARA